MATPTADIGLIGLAVMGENLVLNMESRGYTVAVFNRTTAKVDEFVAGRGKGKKFVGGHSPKELVAAHQEAAQGDDARQGRRRRWTTVIAEVAPLLETGDILIDGGNTHFPDTTRRMKELAAKGIRYIGTGVSRRRGRRARRARASCPAATRSVAGGEADLPGDRREGEGPDGKDVPCCDWVGPEGAGHFVKMVHNGIEYGDMQLICESYQLLKDLLGLTPDELQKVFAKWNKGVLDSYLIEITADIFGYEDPETGKPLVDFILDTAGQKGTGKWTVDSATDNGVAADAHRRSGLRPLPVGAEGRARRGGEDARGAGDREADRPRAVHRRRRDGALREQDHQLRAGLRADARRRPRRATGNSTTAASRSMWRGGCIIRSAFLGKIKEAFDRNAKLVNLLVDPFFAGEIGRAQSGWRRVIGRPRPAASRSRRWRARWPTTTATAPAGCRRTCSRPSATTSARTPTSASTSRAASSSTPTGPAAAAPPRARRTTCDSH